jgi:hypothetical protein
MTNVIVIDTRPGRSCFSLSDSVTDYRSWLEEQYSSHCLQNNRKVYFGIAQQINSILYAAMRGSHVIAIGHNANHVSDFFRDLSGGAVLVEVIE